jgi:hypothetical protein
LLGAIHIAEFLDQESGQTLRPLLAKTLSQGAMQQFLQVSGLAPEDIQHLVVGLRVDAGAIRHFTLILRLCEPFDLSRLRSARHIRRGQRDLYSVPLGPNEAWTISGVSDRLMVICRSPEDFDEVPFSPALGLDHFPEHLQTLLKELGEGTSCWLLGQTGDWDKLVDRYVPKAAQEDYRNVLASVRGFGIWIKLDSGATWNFSFACNDPAAAERLSKYITKVALEIGLLSTLFPQNPGSVLFYRQIAQSCKRDQHGANVVVEAKSSVAAMSRLADSERDP